MVVSCRLPRPHLRCRDVLRKTTCKDVTIKACHSPAAAVEDPYMDFLHSCATSSPADDNSDSIEAAPGDVAAADVAPGHVPHDDVAPLEAVPDDVAATDVALGDVAACEVAPRAGIRKAHLLALLSQVPASEISATLESLDMYALLHMPRVLVTVVCILNVGTIDIVLVCIYTVLISVLFSVLTMTVTVIAGHDVHSLLGADIRCSQVVFPAVTAEHSSQTKSLNSHH